MVQNAHPTNYELPSWVADLKAKPEQDSNLRRLNFSVAPPVHDRRRVAIPPEDLNVKEPEKGQKFWSHNELKIVTVEDDGCPHPPADSLLPETDLKGFQLSPELLEEKLSAWRRSREEIAALGACSVLQSSNIAEPSISQEELNERMQQAVTDLALSLGRSFEDVADIATATMSQMQGSLQQKLSEGLMNETVLRRSTCFSANPKCGAPEAWQPTEPKRGKSIAQVVAARAKRVLDKPEQFLVRLATIADTIEAIRAHDEDDAIELCDALLIAGRHLCESCVDKGRAAALVPFFQSAPDSNVDLLPDEDQFDLFDAAAVAKVATVVKYARMFDNGEI